MRQVISSFPESARRCKAGYALLKEEDLRKVVPPEVYCEHWKNPENRFCCTRVEDGHTLHVATQAGDWPETNEVLDVWGHSGPCCVVEVKELLGGAGVFRTEGATDASPTCEFCQRLIAEITGVLYA